MMGGSAIPGTYAKYELSVGTKVWNLLTPDCRAWIKRKPSGITSGGFLMPRIVERMMGIEPTTTCLGIKRQSVPTCHHL